MTQTRTAKATFTVSDWSEKVIVNIDSIGSQINGIYRPDRGISLATVGYDYSGEINGTGTVTYLITYTSDESPTVGFERFIGSISGHDGSCVFRHIATHGKESVTARIDVIPGMGTGGLEKLRGTAELALTGHSDTGYDIELSFDID
jgi:hypothetical protein